MLHLSISIQKVIEKIEEEIKQAKVSSSEARMRERIHSIKTLCELVLEDHEKKESYVQEKHSIPASTRIQSLQISQPKKLEMDNDANGDSLLDF